MKTLGRLVAAVTAFALMTGFTWKGRTFVSNLRNETPSFIYDDRKPLTIVSFNIRVGYGTEDRGVDPYTLKGRKKKLGPVVEAIQSCGADIVGLQEVLGQRQTLEVARKLNLNAAYADHPTFSPSGPWWGVAILSKYPIVQAEGIQISTGAGNSKTALLCTVDVGGRRQYFVSIHKDKDLKDGGSFRAIMQKIEPVKAPVVLIGDFNMSPFDRRLNILKPRFGDSAEMTDTPSAQEARSVGTFYGIGRIDYVWVDVLHFRVIDAGLTRRPHRDASDHLAYWTKVVPKK
jgi:endonuclease/exonuclease/phosphatase family metal-dependent hydrolase